jgi:hypothetical protein
LSQRDENWWLQFEAMAKRHFRLNLNLFIAFLIIWNIKIVVRKL